MGMPSLRRTETISHDNDIFDDELIIAMLKERPEIVDMDIGDDGEVMVTLSLESIIEHDLAKMRVLTQEDLNIMYTKSFSTRTVSNVTHIVFPCADPVEVIFQSSADKLRGIPFVLGMDVVTILIATLGIREIFQQLTDELLLRDGHRKVFPRVIYLVNVIPLGNILDEILRMIFHPRLQIQTLQNDFCHGESSSFLESYRIFQSNRATDLFHILNAITSKRLDCFRIDASLCSESMEEHRQFNCIFEQKICHAVL